MISPGLACIVKMGILIALPSNVASNRVTADSGDSPSLLRTILKISSCRMSRTTTTRRFKLGRNAKKRVISVLIKNQKTRRRVKLELGELKKIPIREVKQYLKRHGLLKAGSAAPPDVLRMLYEQSVLSGDVYNTEKETLIHNFFHDKEEKW